VSTRTRRKAPVESAYAQEVRAELSAEQLADLAQRRAEEVAGAAELAAVVESESEVAA
jgi:hypothetical protein